MKIVVMHNFYQSDQPSGENNVVNREKELLKEFGQQVLEYTTNSDDLKSPHLIERGRQFILAGSRPVAAPVQERDFGRFLDRSKPDLVHVHNLFPLLSPTLLSVAESRDLPVVSTIHNYRRVCLRGSYFRDGGMCFECDSTSTSWPAVLHGCYRDSRLQSIPMAVSRRRYASSFEKLSHHIALTPFMKSWLITQGVPEENISVRGTSAPDTAARTDYGRNLLYIGRLAEEKGIAHLLTSWAASPLKTQGWALNLAGDGPLRLDVERAMDEDPSIRFHHTLAPSSIRDLMCRSSALVVPSLWLEGFPRVIAEAYGVGLPVIASANANLSEIVGDAGWVSSDGPAGLVDSFAAVLDREEVMRRGALAREKFDTDLEESASTARLLEIYRSLV